MDIFRLYARPLGRGRSMRESGTNAEIKEFATTKYGAQFDLFEKINVNGGNAHPLYNYLKSKQGGFMFSALKWNFTKFLINKEGIPVKRYGPNESPFSFKGELRKELGLDPE